MREMKMIDTGMCLMSETQVTQEQYENVMGTNPSHFCGPENSNLPVETVSWYDAIEYCNKLSVAENLTPCYVINGDDVTLIPDANGYRLPTEKEWEHAAKGGDKSHGYEYAGSNDPHKVAWFHDNSGDHTQPVAEKEPNELGLYDMSGNVWEWCFDEYE